jgi:hypothetical protein
MKAEAINSMKSVITNTIKSASKNEAVAKNTVKDGAKMIAVGQDAAAAQGKAMIKPYVKPEMEVIDMKKGNLKAASGYTGRNPLEDNDDWGIKW